MGLLVLCFGVCWGGLLGFCWFAVWCLSGELLFGFVGVCSLWFCRLCVCCWLVVGGFWGGGGFFGSVSFLSSCGFGWLVRGVGGVLWVGVGFFCVRSGEFVGVFCVFGCLGLFLAGLLFFGFLVLQVVGLVV